MGTVQIDGSTPKITVGNATAEDATILFDGNAQDFYIALDDSADDLLIGLGSTVGTTPAIAIDENLKVNIPVTTASTSASTGSLTTGGGAGIGADLYVGDDVYLITDSAVLGFGADKDTTLTHTDGTGLTLNSTNKLCFNDASQYIQGASNAILDIAATDEIELTSTLVDLNGNLDVSGTTLLPTLGVITAKDLGVGVHIRTADSGASVNGEADELVIEGSGYSGMTILSGASQGGAVMFGDSGNNGIGRLYYDHASNAMQLHTSAAVGLQIDSTGAVTKPLQPAFLARPSSTQSNLAVGSGVKIAFGTEVFDQNNDFSDSSFTAPVTGRYQLNGHISLDSMDSAQTYFAVYFVTSNRNYTGYWGGTGSDAHFAFELSVLADMDASDTAEIQIYQSGGSAQADARTDCWFSGYLVA